LSLSTCLCTCPVSSTSSWLFMHNVLSSNIWIYHPNVSALRTSQCLTAISSTDIVQVSFIVYNVRAGTICILYDCVTSHMCCTGILCATQQVSDTENQTDCIHIRVVLLSKYNCKNLLDTNEIESNCFWQEFYIYIITNI
jgi:hypothetical protein